MNKVLSHPKFFACFVQAPSDGWWFGGDPFVIHSIASDVRNAKEWTVQ